MKPFLVTLYKNTKHEMIMQLSINAYSAEEALYRVETEVRKHKPDFITVCCSYALKEAKEIFEEGYNTVYPSGWSDPDKQELMVAGRVHRRTEGRTYIGIAEAMAEQWDKPEHLRLWESEA
jgi:hypothetical protein